MLWFDSFVWFVARLPSGLTCMLLYLIIETWHGWRRMTWLDFASRDCLWLWELMSHNNEWQGTWYFCSSGESNVILCAFLLAVLILHGVVNVPAALESKLVTQLWSSIPPLHHRLHLNRSKAENGFTGAQIEKKSGQGMKQDKVIKIILFFFFTSFDLTTQPYSDLTRSKVVLMLSSL